MNLSIIIVSWNTRQLLEQCLASIFAHPPDGDFEVLVVDNHSDDGSAGMVKARFPQVQLIENQANTGFARGNNQAIRRSRGEYILLLNPDTVVKPGALRELAAYLDEHPTAGAAGPRLFNPDGSLQASCSPAPSLSREFLRMFHLPGIRPDGTYAMDGWDVHTPRNVDILVGACLLLRRSVLDQVGLLDETYFIYSEEVDLCKRVQQAGWRLVWVPQAQVVHYGGQSTQQVAVEMFLRLYQSKVIYFRKHHGWASALAYKLLLIAASMVRILLTPVAFLQQPAKRQRHLELSSHYSRLILTLPGM